MKEKDGLWIEKTEDTYTIGLSKAKQEELGEITFVSLPAVEQVFNAGDALLEVEAEKSVSEFKSPVHGKVASINDVAIVKPEVLESTDPKESWIVRLSDVDEHEFKEL